MKRFIVLFILLVAVPCVALELDLDSNGYIDEQFGGTNSGSIYTPIVQADDPTVSSDTGIYFPTTSGKMCVKEDTFLWCSAAGTYTPISTTYSLDLTLTGVAGADKVTIGGTDYTSSQVITGLSGVVPITASYGDSDTLDVTGATGTYPSYSITMDADKSAGFAFSVASGGSGSYLVEYDFEESGYPTGMYESRSSYPSDPDYTLSPASVSNEALKIDPSTGEQGSYITLGQDYDELWIAFKYSTDNGNTLSSTIVGLSDINDNYVGKISSQSTTGSFRLYTNGTNIVTPTSVATLDNTYYWVKLHVKKNIAGTGVFEVWVSTDGTWGSVLESITDGTFDYGFGTIGLGYETDEVRVIDDIIISTTDIPDM